MKWPFIIFAFSVLPALTMAQPENGTQRAGSGKLVAAEKTIFYKLGEKTVPIKIDQYGDLKKVVCINLHSNESTSVEAARSVLEVYGGTLVRIENAGLQVIRFKLRGHMYGFDPNGIFSKPGIEKTLKENGLLSPEAIAEVEKFAQRFLEFIPDNISCLIALHNNSDGDYSVETYLRGNQRQVDARKVYISGSQDRDDLVLTTDSMLFQKMADYGYNSIWQDNQQARKDGSLSVYCGERGIRYLNIETEHGKIEQYIEMLRKLFLFLAN